MVKIAEFLDRGVKIALAVQAKSGKALKDFLPLLEANEDVKTLRSEVENFSKTFPMPG
jgi:glycine hydroxymethyltransferase